MFKNFLKYCTDVYILLAVPRWRFIKILAHKSLKKWTFVRKSGGFFNFCCTYGLIKSVGLYASIQYGKVKTNSSWFWGYRFFSIFFFVMAIGRIKISICNVNFTYYFNIVFYIWHYAFEKKHNRIFWAFCDLGYR